MDKGIQKSNDQMIQHAIGIHKNFLHLYYKYKKNKYRRVFSGLFFAGLALFFINSGIHIINSNGTNISEIIIPFLGCLISFIMGLISMLKTKPANLNSYTLNFQRESNQKAA